MGSIATVSTRLDSPSEATVEIQHPDKDVVDLALRQFRCLVADLCLQFGSGHSGGAMGMMGIGIALWKYVMRYSPENPEYFNRDRLVLSNGHTCLFQYIFLHVTGYNSMTMEQLRTYNDATRYDSLCPGHPEIEHEGIEVSTGPLGQGAANAVGLAMATKHLAATYNRPGFDLVDNTTWCVVGDACLQEGITMEAFQLAGHWKLNNLVTIYDNNQSTCDGSVDICNTEDLNLKMKACGWDVIDVHDGSHDVYGLVEAFLKAKRSVERPTFINVHTIIGVGSTVQGTSAAHHTGFGKDGVRAIKQNLKLNPDEQFVIGDQVYEFFQDAKMRGRKLEEDWANLVRAYSIEYPESHAEFEMRVHGKFIHDWRREIPSKDTFPRTPISSTTSASMICNPMLAKLKNLMVGSADLTPCSNLAWQGKVDFQHPGLRTKCGIDGNYTGRYVHWGIREHAMCGISNGLAAFRKGTILPLTSTFFAFYIYAAPSVHMTALQKLQVIHIATHDSIAFGEVGPTHQPIAVANLYRAMPNLYYIRPCDTEETAGAFITAFESVNTPTIISLSAQALEQYPQYSSREGAQKGAYVFVDEVDADVTIIGVGSEMSFAINARELLKSKYHIRARVVSFPCQRLFEEQSVEYRRQVLQYRSDVPRIVVEAYAVNGWERYANAGFNMSTYGKSLPGTAVYEYYHFTTAAIARAVAKFVEELKGDSSACMPGEFRDLNKIEVE